MTLNANDARSTGCVNRQQRAVTTSPGNKATFCLQVVPLPPSGKENHHFCINVKLKSSLVDYII